MWYTQTVICEWQNLVLINHIVLKSDSCYSASVSITWQNMQIIMDFLSKQGGGGGVGECDIS